jgi:hypothetical protein
MVESTLGYFMKRLLSIILLTLLSINIFNIAPIQAETIEFQWSGKGGYTVWGWFQYDETTAPLIFTEAGSGQTQVLERLQISFHDPAGREIASYDNVIDGVAKAEYFQFNFDRQRGKIFGNIDLGGESSGETYWKGVVNDSLSIFQVDGEDSVMDSDSSPIILNNVVNI